MFDYVVSGGTGFLGSWITRCLAASGHNVAVLARPESSSWRLGPEFPCTIAKIPEGLWPDYIETVRPSVLISCDWEGVEGADRNEEKQLKNIHRITSVAHAFKKSGGKKYIGLGSQAEYGNPNSIIDEQQACNPTTIYGQAKLRACLETEDVFRESKTSWCWARIFSTFGPLDTGSWLINTAIDGFTQSLQLDVTFCEQVWSYLYCADAAKGITLIAQSEKSSGIYNLGHPVVHRLSEILHQLQRLTDSSSKINFGAVPYREDQVMHLQPNTQKLEELGWNPDVDMRAQLVETIRWRKSLDISDPFLGTTLPRFPKLT